MLSKLIIICSKKIIRHPIAEFPHATGKFEGDKFYGYFKEFKFPAIHKNTSKMVVMVGL